MKQVQGEIENRFCISKTNESQTKHRTDQRASNIYKDMISEIIEDFVTGKSEKRKSEKAQV